MRPRSFPVKLLPATAAAFLLASGGDVQVHAFGCRPDLIPNGTINSCSNCHLNPFGGGPRNPFGMAVDEVADLCLPFWGPELALLDSDGDGRTNGEELQDPKGVWRAGDPPPGDPSRVTHPGEPDEPPPVSEPSFIRGDGNADGGVDISDGIQILLFLFEGGATPPCEEAANADGAGEVNISDAIYLLGFLFRAGPPPNPPFPDCAAHEAAAGCESFSPCGT